MFKETLQLTSNGKLKIFRRIWIHPLTQGVLQELNICFDAVIFTQILQLNFRYTIREQVLDDGMVSELGISHTFRHDTGVYICQATNSFGQVRFIHQLVVNSQEMISSIAANLCFIISHRYRMKCLCIW